MSKSIYKSSIRNSTDATQPEDEFHNDYSHFKHTKSLDAAKILLDETEKFCNLQEETKRLKSRRQFDEWNQNVHGTIMSKITKKVNTLDSKALNDKRNNDYNKFLDTTNRKAAIFRDIIIESEYDPLEVNRNSTKVVTKKLKDPCKIDQRKSEEENSMLNSSNNNSNNNLSSSGNGNANLSSSSTQLLQTASLMRPNVTNEKFRVTLPVQDWATGKIEATPHGVAAKTFLNSDSANKKGNPSNNSKVILDHFNIPKGNKVVDAEMPVGKRCFPERM